MIIVKSEKEKVREKWYKKRIILRQRGENGATTCLHSPHYEEQLTMIGGLSSGAGMA